MEYEKASRKVKVFNDYRSKLQRALPMDDPIFISKLHENNLLPGGMEGAIESERTVAHKASRFLKHVKKSLYAGYTKDFDALLGVMESNDYPVLNHLYKKMKDLEKLYAQDSDTPNLVTADRLTDPQEATSSGLSKPGKSQLLAGKSSQDMHAAAAVDTWRGPSSRNTKPLHSNEPCMLLPGALATSSPPECTGNASATATEPVDSTSPTVGTETLVLVNNSGIPLSLADEESLATDCSVTMKRLHSQQLEDQVSEVAIAKSINQLSESVRLLANAVVAQLQTDVKLQAQVKLEKSQLQQSEHKLPLANQSCQHYKEQCSLALAHMRQQEASSKQRLHQEQELKQELLSQSHHLVLIGEVENPKIDMKKSKIQTEKLQNQVAKQSPAAGQPDSGVYICIWCLICAYVFIIILVFVSVIIGCLFLTGFV